MILFLAPFVFDFTLNPGPSQLSEESKADLARAVGLHIPEISHRSAQFTQISQDLVSEMRSFFAIPDGYSILYTSSATEAMQIAVESLVERSSFHFVNGAFSELFQKVARSVGRQAHDNRVEWGQSNDYVTTHIPADAELITITYNETSTGVTCADADVRAVREAQPDTLLAVDITSIAGLRPLHIADADLWLFSVQKCFGLPAGLGLMIVSDRAVRRAEELAKRGIASGYFNMNAMAAKMRESAQTVATPNVLNIWLLGEQLKRWNADGGVAKRERQAQEKFALLDSAIAQSSVFTHFVPVPQCRSLSVCCLAGDPQSIAALHERCAKNGIVLGKGYGKLKESTFRIANFPAISDGQMEEVMALMRECS